MSMWVILNDKNTHVKYETDRLQEEGGKGKVEVVFHKNIDILLDRDDRKSIRHNSKVVNLPSVVIPRTGSATDHFALSVLRHFERLGVRLINGSRAIEMTKDKLWASQIFAECSLPIPKTLMVKYPVDSKLVQKIIGFPAVVKTFSGSYGKGVYLVRTIEEFTDFIEFVHGVKQDEAVIVQEYVDSRPGEDIRVYIVGNKVLGAMKRKSLDGSFKANITRGGVGENFPLNPIVEEHSLKAASVLELDIAGIDLLFDGDGYKICEANSAPGFKGFEKYTGVNVAKEIISYANKMRK